MDILVHKTLFMTTGLNLILVLLLFINNSFFYYYMTKRGLDLEFTLSLKFTASTNHPIFWTRICQNGNQNNSKYSNNGNIYNKVEAVRVSLVKQEFLTIPKHLSSSPVFSRVHFSQSFVIRVVFCGSLSFCLCFWQLYCLSLFVFDNCIVCSLLTIVLSVFIRFWQLFCLSLFVFNNCIVCLYSFLTIILSVFVRF